MANELKSILKSYPRKSALGLSLLGIVGATTLSSNIHYGSTNLENPEGNHYVWGFFPSLELSGEINGNFRSYGLLGSSVRVNRDSRLQGNISSYSLIFGASATEPQSKVKGDISNYALFRVNDHNGDFLNLEKRFNDLN